MKANAPEKIYIGLRQSISGGYVYTTVDKDFPNAAEYICADAFIDKACKWIKDNIYYRVYECGNRLGFPTANFINDFKNYMKGE